MTSLRRTLLGAVMALATTVAAGCGGGGGSEVATGPLVDFSQCSKGKGLKLNEENEAQFRARIGPGPSRQEIRDHQQKHLPTAEEQFEGSVVSCSVHNLLASRQSVVKEEEERCEIWKTERKNLEEAMVASKMDGDDLIQRLFEFRVICSTE